jgi:hypothetical protein
VQHTWVTYSRAPDAQLLQLAALAAHRAHNVLYAIVADSVIGEKKDGQATRARGQHDFDPVRCVCSKLIVRQVEVSGGKNANELRANVDD